MGVLLYGDGTDCADASAGEKGDWGMCSRRGVRADRGAGLAKGEGGMMTRGDSGRLPLLDLATALLMVAALDSVPFES